MQDASHNRVVQSTARQCRMNVGKKVQVNSAVAQRYLGTSTCARALIVTPGRLSSCSGAHLPTIASVFIFFLSLAFLCVHSFLRCYLALGRQMFWNNVLGTGCHLHVLPEVARRITQMGQKTSQWP